MDVAVDTECLPVSTVDLYVLVDPDRFPDGLSLARFTLCNWAAEYLTQEAFNHRRGHILNRSRKRQSTAPPPPRPRKHRGPSAGTVVGLHFQPPNHPGQDDPPASPPRDPASSSGPGATANNSRPTSSATRPSSAQRMEVLLPPRTLSRTPSARALGSPNRLAAAVASPPAVAPGAPVASFSAAPAAPTAPTTPAVPAVPTMPATPTMPTPAASVAPDASAAELNAIATPSIIVPAAATSATGAVAPATVAVAPTVVPAALTRTNMNASTPVNATITHQSGRGKAPAVQPSSRVLRSHGAGQNAPSATTAADTKKAPKPKPKPKADPDPSSSSDSSSSSD
ncbi:hypothetical protein FRC08_015255 [Ceratobasidium sp. 394]|nr:hypothetical protein FRC08_015255 [Ceratobasidium sp. 394]